MPLNSQRFIVFCKNAAMGSASMLAVEVLMLECLIGNRALISRSGL